MKAFTEGQWESVLHKNALSLSSLSRTTTFKLELQR